MEITLAKVLKDCMGMEAFACLRDQLNFSISSRNFVVLVKTLNNSPGKVQNGLTQFSLVLHSIQKPVIRNANQVTGFYMKCNTGLKWVNFNSQNISSYMLLFLFHHLLKNAAVLVFLFLYYHQFSISLHSSLVIGKIIHKSTK